MYMMLITKYSMMPPTRSSTVSNGLSGPHINTHQRVHASNPRFLFSNSKNKLNDSIFLGNQSKISTASFELHPANSKKCMAIPGPNVPSDPSSGSWKVWIVGMLITAVLPFWRSKLWPLIKLKGEDLQDRVESVAESEEHVSEIIEKVAEEVEEVADEVADHLQVDGKLKETVRVVESVAKETAKDAHLAEEVIDKMLEVEKEAGSLIDSVVDQANNVIKETKDHP